MRNRSAANPDSKPLEGAERIRTAGSSPSTVTREEDAEQILRELASCDFAALPTWGQPDPDRKPVRVMTQHDCENMIALVARARAWLREARS